MSLRHSVISKLAVIAVLGLSVLLGMGNTADVSASTATVITGTTQGSATLLATSDDCLNGGIIGCLHSPDIQGNFGNTSTRYGLIMIVGNVIKVILGILGVLFVVLMIYAGFVWMVARGNDKEVTRGREMIIQATIGLAIVLSAYALTYFIVDALQKAAGIPST